MISQIDFDHALRITAEILLSNWTWSAPLSTTTSGSPAVRIVDDCERRRGGPRRTSLSSSRCAAAAAAAFLSKACTELELR
eukprot:COSAG01_NODE_417_length_17291_cov_610.598825_10_plen_81_part_00